MPRLLTTRRALASATALATLALTAAMLPSASATISPVVGTGGGSAASDTRDVTAALAPTTAQLVAARALVADAPQGARVTWDERFGTPRTATGTGGYLTGARSGSAVDVARAWVADNREAFGMSAAQVAALAVSRNHALPGTGTRVGHLHPGLRRRRGGPGRPAEHRRHPGRQGAVVRRQPDPRLAVRRLVGDVARTGARLRGSTCTGTSITPNATGTWPGTPRSRRVRSPRRRTRRRPSSRPPTEPAPPTGAARREARPGLGHRRRRADRQAVLWKRAW